MRTYQHRLERVLSLAPESKTFGAWHLVGVYGGLWELHESHDRGWSGKWDRYPYRRAL